MKIAGTILALLCIGYCFGLIQTGYFLSKIKGVDIKHQGSGNSGATNTLRVMGVKSGLIVLFGDILKSVLPCLAVRYLFGNWGLGWAPDMSQAYVLIMGLGVVLGHNYPFYLGFRGGKGIASTGGIAIAFDWRTAVVGLTLFFIVVLITKYVSVGSMTGVATFCIMGIVFTALRLGTPYRALCGTGQIVLYVTAVILIASAAYSHRANWKRLANGTENKFGSGKKKDEETEV